MDNGFFYDLQELLGGFLPAAMLLAAVAVIFIVLRGRKEKKPDAAPVSPAVPSAAEQPREEPAPPPGPSVEVRFCTRCGAKVLVTDSFCTSCGSRVNGEEG